MKLEREKFKEAIKIGKYKFEEVEKFNYLRVTLVKVGSRDLLIQNYHVVSTIVCSRAHDNNQKDEKKKERKIVRSILGPMKVDE